MEGGEGRYYYNLPNVPYVMFFANNDIPQWRGYGLHGTYWHNDFGRVHSHGCINLPTPVAKELYFWTYPMIPEGKNVVYATDDNPGTKIIIHE
jgi:lipoprotein-anchoring transpeptidase ErfK/SrfK